METHPVSTDPFYTKPQIAAECVRFAEGVLSRIVGDAEALSRHFIEPSAGAGAFYDQLPPGRRVGIDLHPHHAEIAPGNFLHWYPCLGVPRALMVAIGNPPFGHRGEMAVRFFCHAAKIADTIAFILPVIFRKYAMHKQLPADFQWVAHSPLPLEAFHTPHQAHYRANTEFQVWTRHTGHLLADKRLHSPPPIAHPDFEMYQYNNTLQARKIFRERFDFAVPCQGYQDYRRRETHVEHLEVHKQWMLFKARNNAVKQCLWGMDYEALAHENATTIPGFRKNDVVRAYLRLDPV